MSFQGKYGVIHRVTAIVDFETEEGIATCGGPMTAPGGAAVDPCRFFLPATRSITIPVGLPRAAKNARTDGRDPESGAPQCERRPTRFPVLDHADVRLFAAVAMVVTVVCGSTKPMCSCPGAARPFVRGNQRQQRSAPQQRQRSRQPSACWGHKVSE